MAQAKPKAEVLRCVESFAYPDPETGVMTVIGIGDLCPAGDPAVVGREHMFEDVGVVVEQATRAPGESRVRRANARR